MSQPNLSTTDTRPPNPHISQHVPEPNVDVIYHNMHTGSEFRTFRAGSDGPVEEVLLRCAKHVQDGCYKIVSISASRHSFVVVMTTELSREELRGKGFPFPIPSIEKEGGEGEGGRTGY